MMYSLRIRELREARGLKQRQVASVLGICQSTYSNYESGRLKVPIVILRNLEGFYQVSADYLLGLTDNPSPYPPGKKR